MRFPANITSELHLGCQMSYFTLVCLWCGRTVSRAGGWSVYGHVINKFSRIRRLLHILTHSVPMADLIFLRSIVFFYVINVFVMSIPLLL